MPVRFGTAGWSIPRAAAPAFPGDGTQLERYAAVMGCVEINSSFHRSHRVQTYERWATSTPAHFRFAVKLPRRITHELRLAGTASLLAQFAAEAGGLAEGARPRAAGAAPQRRLLVHLRQHGRRRRAAQRAAAGAAVPVGGLIQRGPRALQL